MIERSICMVDSFTTTRFAGNPAGVVYPADGLSDQEMIDISRELGASESAFIYRFPPGARRLAIRFFSPIVEMGICSHATIAAFHFLATSARLAGGSYEMESGGGTFGVHCDGVGPHPTTSLVQKDGALVRLLGPGEQERVGAALGLAGSMLEAVIYRAASARVLIALDSREALNAIVMDRSLLMGCADELGVPGFYCYTLDGSDAMIAAHARMFSPSTGVDEDPVTGNAAAALALYHRHRGLIANKATVRYAQGAALGRAGTVSVTVDGDEATISGQAVTVWEGSLLL